MKISLKSLHMDIWAYRVKENNYDEWLTTFLTCLNKMVTFWKETFLATLRNFIYDMEKQ